MSHLMSLAGKVFFWMFRWIYSKVLGMVYGGTPRMVPTMKNSILMESATSLAARIRSQKLTSVEVVRVYISRIQEVNAVLNCVVDQRFEEALEEAKEADDLVCSGAKSAEELESETPFLGVPFTTPESVAVKGLSNTRGVWSKRRTKAEADAGVVSLMRAAGAIPLACTNVSEGCLAREATNPVHGRTDNPYDTNRSVGGPFGGEASLVAASGSPLGVAPSVSLPCAFNGVFGHKPSAHSTCDAAAPISRSSTDLLPALKLLSRNSRAELRLEEPVDVKRLKYYYAEGNGGSLLTSQVNIEVEEALKKAVHHLRNSHKATIQGIDSRAFLNPKVESNGSCLQEASLGKKEKVDLPKELVKALFGKSRHSFAFLLASFMEDSVKPNMARDKKDSSRLFQEFQELLGSDGVFLCPTQPETAFRHNQSLVRAFDFGCADVFEGLGLPVTYCPAGLDSEGLPIGLQVVAATNQDRLTLAVAREIEGLFGGWKPPPTHGNFTLKNTVFHNISDVKVKTL